MRRIVPAIAAGLFVLAILVSCATGNAGSDMDTMTGESAPGLRFVQTQTAVPSEWMGAEPHLVLVGNVNGVEFDIRIAGNSQHIGNLAAKREYQVLAATGEIRYTAFEIAFGAVMEGLEREIELEFEHADFAGVSAGDDLNLIDKANADLAPNGLTGSTGNLELEWEWEDTEESSFSSGEVLSLNGTFVIGSQTGSPENGQLQGGMIGGFFTARFEDGEITGSFTAPVEETEADDVDEFYI